MKLITINLIDHSTGNAYITNTFEEIEKKLDDNFFKLILCGNIFDAINIINNNNKYNQEIIQKYGECILCNKTFCLEDDNYD